MRSSGVCTKRRVGPSLSAGRVQSVAVRLIVEREREIHHFVSEPAYRVIANFLLPDGKTLLKAKLKVVLKAVLKAVQKAKLKVVPKKKMTLPAKCWLMD